MAGEVDSVFGGGVEAVESCNVLGDDVEGAQFRVGGVEFGVVQPVFEGEWCFRQCVPGNAVDA